MEKQHLYDLALPLQQQFRLMARLGLVISVLAFVALLAILYWLLKDQHSQNYLEVIVTLTRSQDQLPVAMLIGGAVIMLVAGLMLFFLMLYSSARVAGPLYRFARNVEMQIDQGPAQIIQLRQGDYLQGLSQRLTEAVNVLKVHYSTQSELVDALRQAHQNGDRPEVERLLRSLEARVNREAS